MIRNNAFYHKIGIQEEVTDDLSAPYNKVKIGNTLIIL